MLKRAGGNIVLVKKTVTEADGTYQYEWVSSSSSYKWRNTGSWYCKAAPPTSGTRYPIVFGAVDKYTTSNYNMTDTTPTIVQLVFRDTAVSSFTVANDATKPLSFQKYSASDSGTANASIYSLSAVPQYINCNARTTSNNRFSLYAADSGPVVFGGGIEAAGAKAQTEAAVHVCGDIRTTGTISHRMLAFTKRPAKPDMSRLFVESGTVAFTNQVAAFDVTNAGFRVATGAMLTFDGRLASAFYQWTAVPQKIVVDGSMRRRRASAVRRFGNARDLADDAALDGRDAARVLRHAFGDVARDVADGRVHRRGRAADACRARRTSRAARGERLDVRPCVGRGDDHCGF